MREQLHHISLELFSLLCGGGRHFAGHVVVLTAHGSMRYYKTCEWLPLSYQSSPIEELNLLMHGDGTSEGTQKELWHDLGRKCSEVLLLSMAFCHAHCHEPGICCLLVFCRDQMASCQQDQISRTASQAGRESLLAMCWPSMISVEHGPSKKLDVGWALSACTLGEWCPS